MPMIFWPKERPGKPGILNRFFLWAGCIPALFAGGVLACHPAIREPVPSSGRGQPAHPGASIPRDSLFTGPGWVCFFPSGCPGDTIPVILALDPQGQAAAGVQRYRQAARKQGVLLCFSSESRNGLSLADSRTIMQAMMQSIRSAFPGKTLRFFLMGFSGGARVCLDAASGIPSVGGILYTGAGGNGPVPGIPLWGLAGESDMNRAEIYSFHARLPQSPPRVLLDHPGKHEWPGAGYVGEWFRWVRGVSGKNPYSSLRAFRDEVLKRARAEKKPLARAALFSQAVFLEETGRLRPVAAAEWQQFRKDAAYREAEKQQWHSFQTEMDWRDRYRRAFMEKEWEWWSGEIARLRTHTRLPGERAIQDRLLGYFSLASYSLSRQALATGNLPLARKILNIYRASDPGNPEAWYLSAVEAALNHDRTRVLDCIRKASANGFSEWHRARSQPEFSAFLSDSAFRELLPGGAR